MNDVILNEVAATVELITKKKVKAQTLKKNNGVMRQAISFALPQGSGSSAVVYVDELIEQIAAHEMPIYEAAMRISDRLNKLQGMVPQIEPQDILNKEFILSHVEYKLVNRNKNQRKLFKIPHKDIVDLSAIYVVRFSEASFTEVSNKLMDLTDISIDELDMAAYKNTEKYGFDFSNITALLARLSGLPESHFDREGTAEMYVLQTNSRAYGAACMLYKDYLKAFADKIGSDLYIMPSSIHELIAVPVDDEVGKVSAFTSIVKSINATEVSDEEYLSDTIYRLHADTGEITIVA